jgi:lysophospholipase L1-like esterase
MKRVAIYGDSLTNGYQRLGLKHTNVADLAMKFAPTINKNLNIQCFNYGIDAQLTDAIQYRLAKDSNKYDVIAIQGGTNDLGNNFLPSKIIEIIDKSVSIAKTKCKLVILVTVPPFGKQLKFPIIRQRQQELNEMIRQLAMKRECKCLDLYQALVMEGEDYMRENLHDPDNLHMNTAGYEIYANSLLKILSEDI